MLDTATVSNYEANLRAHYRQVSQRLNRSPVPKPANENPARSDRSLGQARLENSLAGAETCGVAVSRPEPVVEWVSAQDVIPPAPGFPAYGAIRGMNRVATIINAAARHTGVAVSEIISTRHDVRVVRPRHIGMFLCKTLTELSYPIIGKRFGNRDHTTVISAVSKITRLLQSDSQLAADVAAIRALAVAADPGLAQ